MGKEGARRSVFTAEDRLIGQLGLTKKPKEGKQKDNKKQRFKKRRDRKKKKVEVVVAPKRLSDKQRERFIKSVEFTRIPPSFYMG